MDPDDRIIEHDERSGPSPCAGRGRLLDLFETSRLQPLKPYPQRLGGDLGLFQKNDMTEMWEAAAGVVDINNPTRRGLAGVWAQAATATSTTATVIHLLRNGSRFVMRALPAQPGYQHIKW